MSMRHGAALLTLAVVAVPALAQATGREAGDHQRANESFFGPRAKSAPPKLPTWDDDTFHDEVETSRMPVLVHFALDWNITNRAALAQTEVLQYMNRGAVKVGLLHVDKSPRTMERFPGLEPPAYLLFYQGRKLFHRPGFWQAEDLQQHIDRALADVGF